MERVRRGRDRGSPDAFWLLSLTAMFSVVCTTRRSALFILWALLSALCLRGLVIPTLCSRMLSCALVCCRVLSCCI